MTGPQDQGKPHEDRAAEGGQSRPGMFAEPDPQLQPSRATVKGPVSALVDHANSTVRNQQRG